VTRTLLAFAVLLFAVSACLAQETGYRPSTVVVGQTPQGGNRVVAVIPLKFLDAGVAAQLFGGLGFSGTAFGLPATGGGEYDSSRSTGGVRPRPWANRNQGSNTGNYGKTGGYGGYGQALEQNLQYPGYRSPYGG